MKITSLSINRPVTALMFYVGIILLGVISWNFLPQELFPPLVYPQITVLTKYQQASPYEIESLISRPIEEAVGTVNKVKKVSSISREGSSIVMAQFDWGTNMDFASLEVREKLDLIKEKLPKESEEPIVMKYNPFELPMMRITLTGENNPERLRTIAKKTIKEDLEKVEGVGAVEIVGGLEREIKVELNEGKLRGAYLSILDISNALEKANLNYPAGTIKEPFFEFLVRTVGEFEKVREIEDLPVKAEFPIPEEKKKYFERMIKERERKEGMTAPSFEQLIFIKNIGDVVDGTKERESISRYQGQECVTLLIRKQSQANTVRLSGKIREELKDLEKKLPSYFKLNVVYDEADFIKQSLGDVNSSAMQGGILTFLVILFFLRNWWFSFSVVISIPISIIIVLLLLYLCKMSLNLISLGGLALGVGMLVDNSIVVLESIFINKSANAKDKTIKGTGEVGSAIIGSTITTICVFLPMIYVVGISGQIFKQLSFSIVFSLSASIITAITILPLAIHLYLKRKGRYSQEKEYKTDWWGGMYDFFFKYKFTTFFVTICLFLISLLVFANLKREFFPRVDQHEFIIKLDSPPGTLLETTNRAVQEIENILSYVSQIKEVTVNIGSSEEDSEEKTIQSQGPHQAQIFVKVDKKSSTTSIIKRLEDELKYLEKNGVSLALLAQESFLKEAFIQQAPFILQIKGADLDELKRIGEEIEKKLKELSFLYNIKLDSPPPRPEVKVEIVKDKAFLYNISTHLIAATVNTSLKGKVATKFKEKGEEYDIRVMLRKDDRKDVKKLQRLLVHGVLEDQKITIPLMEIAEIKESKGPLEIKRMEGERTLILTASIYKMPLSSVVNYVNNIITKISMPQGYKVEVSGEAENMKESFSSLRFALILAVMFVFMVMASEFESLWQPFLILFTMPLSIIGVSFILLLTNSPLNVISVLGLIMLGGIVVNNGIVLIEYVNLLQKESKLPIETILKLASVRRLRPILMTSLTTVLGLLPLSLSKNSIMQPLAVVTMGGLISATFLTPVFLPILYYYSYKFFYNIKINVFKFKEEEKKEEIEETRPIGIKERWSNLEVDEGEKAEGQLSKEEKIETQPAGDHPLQIFDRQSMVRHSSPQVTEENKISEEVISDIPGRKIDKDILPLIDREIPPLEIVSQDDLLSLPPLPPIPDNIEEQAEAASDEIKEEGAHLELNSRQKELLSYLRERHKVSRSEYAKIFNISIPTAARDLKDLAEAGFIEAIGPLGPGRIYVLKLDIPTGKELEDGGQKTEDGEQKTE